MTKKYLLFLLLILLISLPETVASYFVMHSLPKGKDPQTVMIIAVVLFLCIPINIFVAWKIAMKPQKI